MISHKNIQPYHQRHALNAWVQVLWAFITSRSIYSSFHIIRIHITQPTLARTERPQHPLSYLTPGRRNSYLERRAWDVLVGVAHVDVVFSGLGGDVLDSARTILVVNTGHLGLRGALHGQTQTAGARAWRGEGGLAGARR